MYTVPSMRNVLETGPEPEMHLALALYPNLESKEDTKSTQRYLIPIYSPPMVPIPPPHPVLILHPNSHMDRLTPPSS